MASAYYEIICGVAEKFHNLWVSESKCFRSGKKTPTYSEANDLYFQEKIFSPVFSCMGIICPMKVASTIGDGLWDPHFKLLICISSCGNFLFVKMGSPYFRQKLGSENTYESSTVKAIHLQLSARSDILTMHPLPIIRYHIFLWFCNA